MSGFGLRVLEVGCETQRAQYALQLLSTVNLPLSDIPARARSPKFIR